jgi:hypothetical protein
VQNLTSEIQKTPEVGISAVSPKFGENPEHFIYPPGGFFANFTMITLNSTT